MARRNIMEALNRVPDGSLPKNVYDLQNYEYLTSKAGQFLPCGYRECVPDGEYDIGVDNYTMTLPCNTSSFADMKENFYFMFIPYYQLDRSFYAFSVQRKDLQSSLDYNHDSVPFFDLGDVVYRCIEMATVVPNIDYMGFNYGANALRLLDLLGYGCYLDLLEYVKRNETSPALQAVRRICNQLNFSKPNVLRIAAYQKAWYCYFRNRQYDINISPRCFNFDDVSYHATGVESDYNVLHHRSLDNFIHECLCLRYIPYKKDIYTASMPGTQFGAVSYVGYNSDLNQGAPLGRTVANQFTDLDYSMWRSGNNGESPLPSGKPVNTYVGTTSSNLVVDDDVSALHSIVHKHPLPQQNVFVNNGMSLFDVFQIVEANAIQKWRQKSMMAGQKMSDQYRAHYGVVPDHMRDDYPDFIGSVDNPIQIDRLINSSNTVASEDMTNLGDLGGRGYGASDRRTFRFKAKEYGVLMVFRAVVPENVYSSFGLDRANQLIHYTDFWQPEYQNLGLQAVDKIELDSLAENVTFDDQSDWHPDAGEYNIRSRVLGYAPRNYQLKQYPSRVHGMFNPTRLQSLQGSDRVPYGFADMQAFVQVRSDLVSGLRVLDGDPSFANIIYDLSKFYVNPSITNSVFVINADSYEESDVFIHKTRIICNAVQPLTELGLPQF